MPQFFPDGPAAINLNAISESGGITIPPEPSGEFDTPGMQGSMQQLLSENLGKFVIADFLIGVSNIVRRVGILYSVGRGFLVIYNEDYHSFQVCDIFSLKFVSFFPPGFEPSLEELVSGQFTSGILNPGNLSGILRPEPRPDAQTSPARPAGTTAGGQATDTRPDSQYYPTRPAGSTGARPSSPSGCRTLGQR